MIEMYIGSDEGGWAVDGQTQAWERHDGAASAVRHWATEIEASRATRWRKAAVDLWLSGGLARPFVCGPVGGLTGWREAQGFAAAMAGDATGQDGPHRAVLESWPGNRSALAIAMTESMAEAIEALRRERRIVWRSIRPKWAVALNHALEGQSSTRLFALAEPDAVTVIGGTSPDADKGAASGFEHASTYPPVHDAAELSALWRRVLLSRDVAEENTWLSEMSTSMAPRAMEVLGDASVPWQRTWRSPWASPRREMSAWPHVARRAEGVAP